jgi:4-hydroxybenzoate polyprenyltransferase
MWVFQFVRFKNLFIVALTQYLLYFLLLIPNFKSHQITPSLDNLHFFLLVFTTVLIAAGGYIINDILDFEMDELNKPDKVFINNQISVSHAWKSYFGIVGAGAIISIYLAIYVNQFPLFFIYPVAVTLLWLYSRSFKKQVLLGNIVVSLFCAFVAGIVIFAERTAIKNLYSSDYEKGAYLVFLFEAYLIFAFMSTLFREIIKDIEDQEGDAQLNCRTLPIVFGLKNAKIVTFLIGTILFILVSFFTFWLSENDELSGLAFSIIGVLAPLGFSIWKLANSKTKKDFHQLSQLSKLIMISGLILLIIIIL